MAKKKATKKKTKKKKSIRPIGVIGPKIQGSAALAQEAKTSPIITPMPTAGRKILEFEERLDKQLGGDETAGRKRGRPRNADRPEPPEIDITDISNVVQIPFDLWALSQNCPELKITTNESILIAKPLKKLLDHYVPQVPEIAWAWISLGAVSYSIMKSRLDIIAEIKKQRTFSSEKQTDAARGAKVPPTRGHGSPAPSAVFPSIDQVTKQET